VTDSLKSDADALAADLVVLRRDIHRNPELGFEEVRTAELVAGKLRALGLEVETGVAQTGVVGILRAPDPKGGAVLLRADMDALPIQEVSGRDYGSSVPGRMHACGHDGHTAMLLGAATLLAKRRSDLRRDVAFCFQPAEEGMGGARRMIDEGLLDRTGAASAFALHLWAPLPAGEVYVRPGPAMAGNDEFTARFVGRGGHGAEPHTAVDPIVAAAQGVLALQPLVARELDPLETAVVTVGSFRAGSAPNVIPEQAELEGTLRAFTDAVRRTLRERTEEVLTGAATTHRCRLEFELRPGNPAVVNDPASVERVREVAFQVVGEPNVREHAPMAAAEDFGLFLERVPGAFFFLGAGDERKGTVVPHHSPAFDFEESVLPRGAEMLARLALHGP
jgi:amidohydrolase